MSYDRVEVLKSSFVLMEAGACNNLLWYYTFFYINNQKFKQLPQISLNLLNNFQTIFRGEQETKIKQPTARTG